MKKNIWLKGILLLTLVALLTMGLAGCGIVITTTGTVYITVMGDWWYDIYMDGDIIFSNVREETYTIKVLTGEHFFEAIDTAGSSRGYDSVTKYIFPGNNYVVLEPKPNY